MEVETAVKAIEELLADEGSGREVSFVTWRTKSLMVLSDAFGPDSVQAQEFAATCRATGRHDAGPLFLRRDAISRGKAVLKVALDTLSTRAVTAEPIDRASIDPELWTHVERLVADEDWAKIPAAVAIFVEDRIRTWAGEPTGKDGAALTARPLYGKALADGGPLMLGSQSSEHEGWRALGTGMALAIGNVDRHRRQQRNDLRRYAIGVLGLGSLLLTQIRHQHPTRAT
jgi:hypothetical protein